MRMQLERSGLHRNKWAGRTSGSGSDLPPCQWREDRSDLRVLVACGKHFDNMSLLRDVLDAAWTLCRLTVVIHGGHARSGPAIEEWARDHDVNVVRYPANWRHRGRQAELERNAFMLRDSRPDLVITLPGGRSTSTLAWWAEKDGIPVIGWEPLVAAARDQRQADGDGPKGHVVVARPAADGSRTGEAGTRGASAR